MWSIIWHIKIVPYKHLRRVKKTLALEYTHKIQIEMDWKCLDKRYHKSSTKIYPKRENEERPTKNKMKANRWKKNLKTWTLSGGEVELKNGQQWRGVPHIHEYMQKSNILSYVMVIAQPFCSWMRQKIHALQCIKTI